MKKLLTTTTMSMLVVAGAQAQTLEERVEALEYKSYENFLKVSGELEMRFDSVNRNNKEGYTYITDATTYGTDLATANASSAIGTFLGTACGDDWRSSTTDNSKDGCVTLGDDQKDNATYARMFMNLNIESNPSNRLTFYGRLSMAKYLSEISSTGNRPNEAAFSDLSAGANADRANLWVERAFANYKMNDTTTLTFGRLPTIDGAPLHHHRNQPMTGSYPIMAFSASFDGIAVTKNIGQSHVARVIYSPFSTPNYSDSISKQTNSDGDRVPRLADAFAAMYEYNTQVSFARKLHVIAMHNSIGSMPIAGTNLTLGLQRTAFYAELLGIAGSNFSVAVHGMSSTTQSDGSVIGLTGSGGWLTTEDDDKNTGSASGALVKYNFDSGFMKGSSLGVEFFTGSKGAFLYDPANNDPVSMYTTYGSAYRVFYAKDFEGGLKWIAQYMNQQQDYTYAYVGLIGDEIEIDRNTSFVSTSLIANF